VYEDEVEERERDRRRKTREAENGKKKDMRRRCVITYRPSLRL